LHFIIFFFYGCLTQKHGREKDVDYFSICILI